MNTDLHFSIFQLSEKKNDPNIHAFLTTLDPDFGYFPNDRKCWIIAKAAKEESVREAFKDTSINVTVQGQKNLGAARIKEVFRETCQRKGDQLDQWHSSVGRIWSISTTSVLRSHFLRTLPDIQDLLQPLENAISHMLVPAITERKCNQLDGNILALGWPGPGKPVPWSKARICFVCQDKKAPCWTNCISVTSVTLRFPRKTSTTGSKKWKIKGTRTQGRAY